MFRNYKELEKSAFKSWSKFDNTIPPEYVDNADALCNLMNRIEKQWGESLDYTNAYRSPVLNTRAGGHPKSPHMQARAIDVVVPLKRQNEFMDMLIEHFFDEIDFAQAYIVGKRKSGKLYDRNFIHINIAENPRNVFNIEIIKGLKRVYANDINLLKLKEEYIKARM